MFGVLIMKTKGKNCYNSFIKEKKEKVLSAWGLN